MKGLPTYINEKLIIKQKQIITPNSRQELDDVILDHFKSHDGDLNDIDVSKLKEEDFYRLFLDLKYEIDKYNITEIDISDWELKELYFDEYRGRGMFDTCMTLETIILPDCLEVIDQFTFLNCYKLNNMIIPDTVSKIGEKAFYNCVSLKSPIIPDSVGFIGESAFEGCSSLMNVTIPASVTFIGYRAFYYRSFNSHNNTIITVPNENIKKLVLKSGFKGEIIVK